MLIPSEHVLPFVPFQPNVALIQVDEFCQRSIHSSSPERFWLLAGTIWAGGYSRGLSFIFSDSVSMPFEVCRPSSPEFQESWDFGPYSGAHCTNQNRTSPRTDQSSFAFGCLWQIRQREHRSSLVWVIFCCAHHTFSGAFFGDCCMYNWLIKLLICFEII